HLPGWADNRETGRNNVNEGKTYGTRAVLLWRPGPDIEASLSGIYSYTKLDGANDTLAVTDTIQPRFGEYVYNSSFDGGATLEYYSATATVDYDVGPGSFILAGTYAHYSTDIFLDYTNTYSVF